MKNLFSYMTLFCFGLATLSCHHTMTPQKTAAVSMEVQDTKGNLNLLGRASRTRLEQTPFGDWYNKNYNSYVVDSITAAKLRAGLAGKRLLVFMGTWCGDSRREVPRFFKILDYCGIDSSAVELVTVNNTASAYKQSPGHEEAGRNIHRVPDFIVLDQGKEIGRVVESPRVSMEKDLLAIVSGEHYTPNYPAEILLGEMFRREKLKKIRKRIPALTEKLRPLVNSSGELTSYEHVLKAAGQTDQADLVTQLKNRLFPGG